MIKCNTYNILNWILESEKKTLVENWWNLNEVCCSVNSIVLMLISQFGSMYRGYIDVNISGSWVKGLWELWTIFATLL